MEMDNKTRSSIRVSEDAVAKIAKIAALETEGVYDIYQGLPDLKDIRISRPLRYKIGVSLKEDTATIDLHLCLLSNAKVRDTAVEVQKNVKSAVQNTTGIAVSRINVHVDGIRFESEQTD